MYICNSVRPTLELKELAFLNDIARRTVIDFRKAFLFYSIMEVWKDIKGYEGLYQVSDLGRVKSLSRYSFGIGRSRRKLKERILVITTLNNRDSYVTLSNKNGGKNYKVHKLVAEHFLGHKTDGTQVLVIDHINNIKSDNRLENLQIITQRENSSKDKTNGTSIYTGVGWYKNTQKWRAKILIKDKTIHLGYFDKEYDAHLAYQKALSFIENNKDITVEEFKIKVKEWRADNRRS